MPTDTDNPIWQQPAWVEWTQLLLNSYQHWVGKDLVPRLNPLADSHTLFTAPFVTVSHGTESNPLLNYGNQTALDLWEMPLANFLGTPSRETAEPVHRDERSELLRRTTEHGFIDDYSGIRISATGQRFRIHQATVWNILNSDEKVVGQAAAFSQWTPLGLRP